MKLTKQGETFTYELTDQDLLNLTRCLNSRHRRAIIRLQQSRRMIGSIEFTTMQFRPVDRESAGLDPINLDGTNETYIEYKI